MADTPDPGAEPIGRKYTIDDDGNVHGVVLTMQVDYLVEFNDVAIPLAPATADPPPAG